MARIAFNHRVTTASPYVVPAGNVAQFTALSLGMTKANLLVGGAEVAAVPPGVNALGPLYANAGDTVATGENPFGISGFLEPFGA